MYTTVYKGREMALSLGFRARSSSTSPLSPHIFMASSLGSLSSLLPHPLLPTPRPNPRFLNQPHRTASFRSCLQAQRETEIARESSPPPPPPPPLPPPPPPSEKRSFAVAAGELLLGLASRLVRRGKDSPTLSAEDFAGEDVEKVVEDPIDRGVIWEQRSEDVEAEKERKAVTSPGFSFSAAGLLFPYHLGVAKLLLEKGYIKETTPLAGSSAGAIVCAVIASGSSMQDALKVTKVLAEDCRLKGTAFRLGAVLREVLNEIFPDDVHLRCNGRVRIAVTQLLWRPKGLLVDKFDSKEDLINAVFTSSFIPGYLAPRPATMFRNRLCIDGGLTLFMPPTSASATVRICAFPAFQLGLKGIGISPDCNPENRAGPRQLLNWALEPAEDDVLDKLYELGYLDAAVWAEQNPVESIVKDDSNPNIL